jgi:uncharacterized protein with PIN domain
MAINLGSQKSIYEDLKEHLTHSISLTWYGDKSDPVNVAIECDTCACILVDASKPGVQAFRRVVVKPKKAKTNLFGCKECGRMFENFRQLNGHMSAHRPRTP